MSLLNISPRLVKKHTSPHTSSLCHLISKNNIMSIFCAHIEQCVTIGYNMFKRALEVWL